MAIHTSHTPIPSPGQSPSEETNLEQREQPSTKPSSRRPKELPEPEQGEGRNTPATENGKCTMQCDLLVNSFLKLTSRYSDNTYQRCDGSILSTIPPGKTTQHGTCNLQPSFLISDRSRYNCHLLNAAGPKAFNSNQCPRLPNGEHGPPGPCCGVAVSTRSPLDGGFRFDPLECSRVPCDNTHFRNTCDVKGRRLR